jgi:hypothetical protein
VLAIGYHMYEWIVLERIHRTQQILSSELALGLLCGVSLVHGGQAW